MKLSTIVKYKVVEAPKALVILYASDKVPGSVELVIADLATCCEFLMRYSEARATGNDVEHAKELALRGARMMHAEVAPANGGVQ